ncbi:MAG: PD-(D/E)XK nuclease family protein [Nitrospinae bacterium]|nr:PD-(D/E)XK nuclease family protein [Nitrospinota bacterium]
MKTQEEGIGNLSLEKLTLESNFRSQEGLVDWVNQCFQKILPKEDNPDSGAIAFSKSTAIHARESYPGVVLHPLHPELNSIQASQSEAKEVSQIIQNIRQESAEATIAILVRGRTHLKEIIRKLEFLQIPYKAEAIYTLADRPAIRDLLSLLRALLFPLDRVAWLSLLRAPWAGVSLEDLHALCASHPETPLWEILSNNENLKDLSSNGKIQIKRLSAALSPTLNALPSNNFRELLENCWIRLGGPACHEGTSERDIDTFFDEVERIMQKGESGRFEHFNQVIENLHASPLTTSKNAIQIMTMHKAKGLEFDYVILPGLGKQPRQDSKRLVFWMPYGRELLLAPLEEKGDKSSPLYNFLAELDKEKDDHEMLRLLYVAATRAKKQLHLLGKTKIKDSELIPESNSLLESLWPFLKKDWCNTEIVQPSTKQEGLESSAEMFPLKRIPSGYQLPEPFPSIHSDLLGEVEEEKEKSPFLWAGNTARCIGNVLHRVLQTIVQEGLDKWTLERIEKMAPQLRSALLGEGLPIEQTKHALQLALTGLRNTLEDPRGQWILSNHEEGHAEYPLTLFSENKFIRNIIDRTFIEKNIRWIIDYKTGRHEGKSLEHFLDSEVERYEPQLKRYENLLVEDGETRPIKKALYFPLIKAWREIKN